MQKLADRSINPAGSYRLEAGEDYDPECCYLHRFEHPSQLLSGHLQAPWNPCGRRDCAQLSSVQLQLDRSAAVPIVRSDFCLGEDTQDKSEGLSGNHVPFILQS